MRTAVALSIVALLVACGGAQRRRTPRLAEPEIVISLRGLTVHLFDRATGTSFVYAAKAGKLDANGRSATPVGRFATGPDPDDRWWYMDRRWKPEKFAGQPFLRLTATNHRGENVYGIHGPIEGDPGPDEDYVSRGCVRLSAADIRDLYEMVRDHPSTPVTIQEEVELDADGNPVQVTISTAR